LSFKRHSSFTFCGITIEMPSALSLKRSIFAKRIRVEESKIISMYTMYYNCNRFFNRYDFSVTLFAVRSADRKGGGPRYGRAFNRGHALHRLYLTAVSRVPAPRFSALNPVLLTQENGGGNSRVTSRGFDIIVNLLYIVEVGFGQAKTTGPTASCLAPIRKRYTEAQELADEYEKAKTH